MLAFQRIALIGPGLLGGSMGLALRALPQPPQVRAWARREENIERLLADGCADVASTELDSSVDGADLIVLATPVGAMADLARRVVDSPGFLDSAVITDVGSVKQRVVSDLEPIFDGSGHGRFVGSHPMAGSEKTGVAAARSDLFDQAVCLLTPSLSTDAEALNSVIELWRTLGMRTTCLDPAEHDRAVARISHLPHLTAAALVMAAHDDDAALAGPGFRDSTRIAAGSAEMWTEILLENREALRSELESLQDRVGETLAFLDKVNEKDLHQFLSEAKRRRDLFSAHID